MDSFPRPWVAFSRRARSLGATLIVHPETTPNDEGRPGWWWRKRVDTSGVVKVFWLQGGVSCVGRRRGSSRDGFDSVVSRGAWCFRPSPPGRNVRLISWTSIRSPVRPNDGVAGRTSHRTGPFYRSGGAAIEGDIPVDPC